MRLPQSFFLRGTLTVARDLLGKAFTIRAENQKGKSQLISGIIVETEAYLAENDPACHAFSGPTPRTQIMFQPGGLLYVYFIYGMYHCVNIVTESEGRGAAVLLRAVEPREGISFMQQNRPTAKHLQDVSNGPGKLAQAFGLTRADNATVLTSPKSRIYLEDINYPPQEVVTTTRIGIKNGKDYPYRFYLRDNPYVSKK
ncbi:MAG: DNA-3-methyladenine glycosylase [Candidatus Magnetoglobus multicellularis str. Araruama]|uniref:Putative 3-methyladenine DNA glycosylase n=1 Tax=Candidatus Magnetoglobus multicellularis str. Araruama TaxID=890399 RepID=A0A1V1NZT9_9BACT|nr:MAG: DNA-3-methyladenine glycosylase [Candidatus Magnetoglobus multicellularis str. Araruama]